MTCGDHMLQQSANSSPAKSRVDDVREVWESLAQDDPLWAILSSPEKKGNEWNLEEFLETGVVQIDNLMRTLQHHEIAFEADAVLDFGCGVGRLSQALLPYFRSVCGVDVAPTMICRARELNKDTTKCNYFLNQREDLKLFQDRQFSFIYSILVLQHLPTELAYNYIAEFVRILRLGGILVFHLPARFVQEQELPSTAFSAIINCHHRTLTLRPNDIVDLRVEVENSSPVQWNYNEPFPISLGNHWLAPDGSMHVVGDGRKVLPKGLLPGQRVDMASEIVELLYRLGCRTEFIEASGLGGKGTLSYLYYARKCAE